MTSTIFDAEGDVYMTLPDAVPSYGDTEGWMVRHVSSGTHGRDCGHQGMTGTYGLTSEDVDSYNGVLRLVGEFSGLYGYRPTSSRIGVDSFRWTFERDYGDGHRGSDMIIASRIH